MELTILKIFAWFGNDNFSTYHTHTVVTVDEEGNSGCAGLQHVFNGVTQEVIQSMINNHQRQEDRYWMCSLMITAGTSGHTDYRSFV